MQGFYPPIKTHSHVNSMFDVLLSSFCSSFSSCFFQTSKQRRCPRVCSQPAQLCQLCPCSPLAECVQPSIISSQWSFSPRHHHSLCSQNTASLHIPRLQPRPQGEGSEVAGWGSQIGTSKNRQTLKCGFGIIWNSLNYFLIITLTLM